MAVSADLQAAMDRALAYLTPKPRSRWEVAACLQRAGFQGPTVEQVLGRLAELALVDDAAFAREAARQTRARGGGAEVVRRHLSSRRVSKDTIEAAVAETFPREDARELVLAAASNRALALSALPLPAQRRRLAGYLARRGHDPELIHEVCRQVLEDFDSSD